MCEIRDPSIKWPHWHTLIFSNEITIDMRYVCPKDVKKMVVQRARLVNWKKWAAKHEYEELKEGTWLEPGLALLRKKVKENWTVSHRTVAGRSFWKEVGRKKDYSTLDGQSCQMEEGTEKHRVHHCSEWHAVRREIPEAFRKWEQKAKVSKKEWK